MGKTSEYVVVTSEYEALRHAVRRSMMIAPTLAMPPRPRQDPALETTSYSFWFRLGIDLQKLGRFTDELEAEAFAKKIHDPAGRKRPRSRAQR